MTHLLQNYELPLKSNKQESQIASLEYSYLMLVLDRYLHHFIQLSDGNNSVASDTFNLMDTHFAGDTPATLAALRKAAEQAGWQEPLLASSPAEAVGLARKLAAGRGLICVAGSFFLAAEARAALVAPGIGPDRRR